MQSIYTVFRFYICFSFCANLLFAQNLPTADPEAVGLSPRRLQRIDAVLQGHVEKGELAGAVALISRRGKVAYFKSFGMLDIEAGKAMPKDAIFRIASMTKPITSAAVMMLYEEGSFLLSDPASKYIPELKNMKVAVVSQETDATNGEVETVPANRPITIRDLLRHTSGFTYGFINRGPVGKLYRSAGLWTPESTLADFVAELVKLPLVHQPATAFEYSVSVDVLGYLIERVSGQPFDEFLQQRIFAPLGMVDTDFYVPEEKWDRFAALYKYDDESQKLVKEAAWQDFTKAPSAPSGGGGLVSTTTDYLRFCQMMLNGGELDGVRIIGRKTVELMTSNHLTGDMRLQPGVGFGLGFAVIDDVGAYGSLSSAGAFSWGGIYNTIFWIDPQEEMIGLFMMQANPSNYLDLRSRIRVLTYQALH